MNTFLTILSMSISASVMLILLLAIKRIIKNSITANCMYVLLLIVMLRLIFTISIEQSIMNYLPNIESNQTKIETLKLAIPSNSSTEMQLQDVSNTSPSIKDYTTSSITLNKVILTIWLTGMVISFSIKIVSYLRYIKHVMQKKYSYKEYQPVFMKFTNSRRIPSVYISSIAVTPMVIGCIKPSIILPEYNYSQDEIYGILKHEYCHYRRFDVQIKWIAAFICSIHWFNPIISILFARKLEEYCELSCDEYVVYNMNPSERKSYIRTLIRTAEIQLNSHSVLLTTMSGSAKQLNNRLNAAYSAKKATWSAVISMAVLVPSIVCIGLILGVRNTYCKIESSYNKYEYIEYGITAEGLIWSEKENMWVNPLDNGTYNFDTIRTGRTDDNYAIEKLFGLVNVKNYSIVKDAFQDPEIGAYDYLDTDPNNSGILTIGFIDNVGNYTKIAMDKNGQMVLMTYYYSGEKYERLAHEIYQNTLEQPEYVIEGPTMFSVPKDLYNNVAEILFTLPVDPYDE